MCEPPEESTQEAEKEAEGYTELFPSLGAPRARLREFVRAITGIALAVSAVLEERGRGVCA